LIKFTGVELAYREGLPLVLKGISFEVVPGEKVGYISYGQPQSDNSMYRSG
jgi:ATP-binding cassette, subfamily C (CFTR/MRP), member 1